MKSVSVSVFICITALFVFFFAAGCSKRAPDGGAPARTDGEIVEALRQIAGKCVSLYARDVEALRAGRLRRDRLAASLAELRSLARQVRDIEEEIERGSGDSERKRHLLRLALDTHSLLLCMKEALRREAGDDPAMASAHADMAREYKKRIEIWRPEADERYKNIRRPLFTRRKPNFLLIVVDTLRADHVSGYGYTRTTTPALDRLAAGGTVYLNAVTQAPYTSASTASILTGLLPSRHGLLTVYRWETARNLAEVFRKAGFSTAAFSANQIVSPQNGFGHGFDTFVVKGWAAADILNNEIQGWLPAPGGRPFFAYVHYMDPHDSYNAPDEFENMFASDTRQIVNAMWFTNTLENKIEYPFDIDARGWVSRKTALKLLEEQGGLPDAGRELKIQMDRYDGEIRFADEMIGRLLDRLRRDGLLENTIVVVTSDHGEAFLEHGHIRHSRTLYDELIHVPLIVWDDGKLFAPRHVAAQVEVSSIFPTLMSAAGIKPPVDLDFDALPKNEADAKANRPALAATWQGWSFQKKKDIPKVSIRTATQKVIYTPTENLFEYYALKNDPNETRNIAGPAGKNIPPGLKRQVTSYYKSFSWIKNKKKKDINEKLKKDLKSLQYIK